MSQVPFIPENAPFSAVQRQWLNGYLAGLLSSAAASAFEEGHAPPSRRPKLLILFGSQTGNAEGLARDFSGKLGPSGFETRVLGMEDFESVDFAKEEKLLIISSTWGDGDPPDNAVEFWNSLSSDEYPRLEHLCYAVLGLGDTNYLNFCAMGKLFDARLESLGAARLVPRGDCDVDFEASAEAWLKAVTEALGTSASALANSPEVSSEVVYSKKNPFPAILKVNRKLNGEGAEKDTRHFEISLEGSGLSYEVGDVLGVIPENCLELVNELLDILGYTGKEMVPLPDGGEGKVREALLRHYAITSPGKKLLQAVASRSGSLTLAATLEDSSALGSYLWGREIIDLLLEYPAARFTPVEFIALLGKLNPRLYSIASSPRAHEGEVHLTVARVGFESNGRTRKGVCSTYLSDRVGKSDKVKVFLQTAKHFKLPEDTARPVIMVGPGTGIAPFRAFLEDRKFTKARGANWLLFGNPYSATDFLYEDELMAMVADGTLSRLDVAWSRDQEKKIYVQDKMLSAASELWGWLDKEKAHFYVCGDAKRMAKDVDDALHSVIAEQGKMSPDDAAIYVSQMKKDKRYQRDVY